ncbi:hypothetical protein Mnod_5731 [Methylobacterium nodulans ORS 2060]|uniref:Uncharacterized protein n=1 Tax=Methylobacterium nodulans (strain LMG 21967 / CNCM I-2342 / ORS 2060) TaxID=460265 RepID=B8IRL1_METNO|nr:hypothetical protein Mnod_5731 [Methylobacterium nodulans ORS 2060]
MSGPSRAYVLHRTPHRLRVRIPNRRRDQVFFRALQRTLSEHPDVFRVDVNPRTASVIIRCHRSFDPACINNPFLGVILAAEVPQSTAMSPRPASGSARAGASEPDLSAIMVNLALAAIKGQLKAQLLEWALEWAVKVFVRALVTEFRPAPSLRPSPQPALLAA